MKYQPLFAEICGICGICVLPFWFWLVQVRYEEKNKWN